MYYIFFGYSNGKRALTFVKTNVEPNVIGLPTYNLGEFYDKEELSRTRMICL
jgi:hypothetical protein